MKSPIRIFTIINYSIVVYFLLIFLSYKFEIDFVVLGVLRELLTIPFLLAQLVFIILGIIQVYKGTKELSFVVSLIALILCAILTLGSFF